MKFVTEDEVLAILKAKAKGVTLKQLSAKLGFSYQYLSEVLKEDKPVTSGLARALGFTRVFIKSEDNHA